VTTVSRELSISTATLERWRADALSRPARERAWTAPARFDAVLLTAAMDEAGKSAWCREHGRVSAGARTVAYGGDPGAGRALRTRTASHQETEADRRRIKELERDLRRKEKALAEAAALLVLSKKLEAIFPKDKDEDA
jgi:transposase